MTSIFFSYSHADEGLRDRLEKGLAMLKQEHVIDTWHDRRIQAGDELDKSIDAAMEKADLILLLVSPDFLASTYCYDVEVQRALERHERGESRVIPVILRPCDWLHSPLSKLMATPTDGRPITKWTDLDDAFQDVVSSIRAALPKSRSRAPVPEVRTSAAAVPLPRSSNLRLSKTFTQADKDRFLDKAFDFMALHFEGSLGELRARNPEIDFVLKRLDQNRFTAVVYRSGDTKARCKIVLGGMFGNGISFSNDDRAADGSSNENLSVVVDDQGIYLRPMGMAQIGSNREHNLSFEGAAEYYWELLMRPLQRD